MGDAIFNGEFTANGAVDFRSLPTCATQASNDNQLVNLATLKKYAVDKNLIKAICDGAFDTEIYKKIKVTSNVIYTNNSGKTYFFYGTWLPKIPGWGSSKFYIGGKSYEWLYQENSSGDSGAGISYSNLLEGGQVAYFIPNGATYKWLPVMASTNGVVKSFEVKIIQF